MSWTTFQPRGSSSTIEDFSKQYSMTLKDYSKRLQDYSNTTLDYNVLGGLSGILPGYSCKEGGRVEDGLLLEFPCTPTRTRSV
jgi:hypothetical protein